MGALTLTGDYRRPPLEPGLPGVIHWMDTDAYANTPSPDSALGIACADRLGRLLELEGQGTIAAVILEPLIQGAAGMVMHDEEFVRAVREACDQHTIPMIADEVMTGFGRPGALFACDRAGVAPDLLCLAKGLTGGAFNEIV